MKGAENTYMIKINIAKSGSLKWIQKMIKHTHTNTKQIQDSKRGQFKDTAYM